VKVLLVGATGQLGSALRPVLAAHEVAPFGSRQLDVRDAEQVRSVLTAQRPDVVVNCSAWTDVDGAESDPQGAFATNADGPRHLAEVARDIDAALLHVSTDYVFDGEKAGPTFESDAPNPLQVYGESKLAGERAVLETWQRSWVVRTAWLYSTTGRNFALTMRGLAAGGVVRVVDDQFGCPTYAPQLAAALGTLIEGDAFGLRHLAADGLASWWEFAGALFRAQGLDVRVEPVTTAEFPRPARRPRRVELRSERAPVLRLPPWQDGVAAFARDLA
jgi:dTDP-4-dehydrorhamnose reductase